jgi:hypothetical protein
LANGRLFKLYIIHLTSPCTVAPDIHVQFVSIPTSYRSSNFRMGIWAKFFYIIGTEAQQVSHSWPYKQAPVAKKGRLVAPCKNGCFKLVRLVRSLAPLCHNATFIKVLTKEESWLFFSSPI